MLFGDSEFQELVMAREALLQHVATPTHRPADETSLKFIWYAMNVFLAHGVTRDGQPKDGHVARLTRVLNMWDPKRRDPEFWLTFLKKRSMYTTYYDPRSYDVIPLLVLDEPSAEDLNVLTELKWSTFMKICEEWVYEYAYYVILCIEPTSPLREESCVICFDVFQIGDQCRKLKCKHVFHKDCVEPWVKAHSNCPLCRSSRI